MTIKRNFSRTCTIHSSSSRPNHLHTCHPHHFHSWCSLQVLRPHRWSRCGHTGDTGRQTGTSLWSNLWRSGSHPESCISHSNKDTKLCSAAQNQLTSIINGEKISELCFLLIPQWDKLQTRSVWTQSEAEDLSYRTSSESLNWFSSQWFLSIKRFILFGWVSSALNEKSNHWKIQISAPRILMSARE